MTQSADAPRDDSRALLQNAPAGVTGRAGTVVAAVSLCVTAIAIALVLTFDHGRDQAIYALVAREMLDGKMPYRDAFDFKPPGVFVVYAFARALFGASQSGIRIVEAVAMLGSVWGMVRLSELHLGRRSVGFMAGALASLVHAQLDFWHTAQPETFGGTLTIWGLVLATTAHRSQGFSSVGRWAVTGVLFGCAGLMKPPLAGVGALLALVSAGYAVVAARRAGAGFPRVTAILIPLGATAIGGALPIAATLVWFAAKGALHDLHQVLFVFTPYYTKISWEGQSVMIMSYHGFLEWLTAYSSALFGGMVLLAIFRPEPRAHAALAVLFGSIAVHLAGVIMQGKFFPYHYGATFPLTALAAGLGFEGALAYALRRGRALGAAVFAVGTVLLFVAKCPVPSFGEAFGNRSWLRLQLLKNPPAERDLAWDSLASVADVNAHENRAVARYLAANTQPGDAVFVWGFECIIYDLAERPLSSRYIYNVPQRAVWSREPMQAALMTELRAKPPRAIVVEHHDVFRMVTGSDADSARSLYE
ncbi:MAG: glycosyltransferase family 39 protein, partial [Myxococcales bacterium]|nr:glycosyltransferase family 39 protein [Myxococcales bacterium]